MTPIADGPGSPGPAVATFAGRSGFLVASAASSAAWLFGAIVATALALRPVVGDGIVLTRYTGYVMPWLLAGLLPGAAWAWRTRRRALAAGLGACAAVIGAADAPLFLPSRGRPVAAPAGATLEVMSYNTWSANRDARAIARVIRERAPDLVLLQEIPPEVLRRVIERVGGLYGGAPVHHAYERGILQAVVSRWPIESSEALVEKGQAQRVVLRVRGRPVTVFNVHPLRTGGWFRRYEQIAALLEEDVRRERGPVILGGDLNAPDHSQLYRLVARHLRNAHREAGWGFGFTYPTRAAPLPGWLRPLPVPAAVRIDHVFFSGDFVALRAGTLRDAGGSDHRPVFAELALE